MDDSFFQDLDRHITNIGMDKCWQKKIGDTTIWISPVPYAGQIAANEALSRLSKLSEEETGINSVQETKRITLSHAIVGFDNFDLRPYRFAGSCIPVLKMIDGENKIVKVELHKYVYNKIKGWDSEFVDIIFDVFADLSEANKKDMLKEVKFESAKDPHEELAEIEMRVSELRDQLNLQPMVESEPIDEDSSDVVDGSNSEDFDPFTTVNGSEPQKETYGSDIDSIPIHDTVPITIPEPVRTVPIPVVESSPIQRELDARIVKSQHVNSINNPHVAIPSVPDEIIENRSSHEILNPPTVDPNYSDQSRNSRFSPPQGR